MRIFQTWNGKAWIDTPIEELPIGHCIYVRVIEVNTPVLNLDNMMQPIELRRGMVVLPGGKRE